MLVHAFVFPGQGSQSTGMGRDLAAAFAAARLVFQEVDDALNQRLSKLMFEGPSDELTLTENAQPALLATAIAALRVMETEGGFVLRNKAVLVAGHSLGEYAALTAAGAFRLADAARLLRIRGRAMRRAVPDGAGSMAALLGVTIEDAQAICAEAAPGDEEAGIAAGVVDVANDNGAGQVVISGDRAAVERAVALAKTRGVRRALLLPVSAPFHCALMAPAARAMEAALAGVAIAAPTVPVVANVFAAKVTDPALIPDLLVRQVTGMVRWRETVLAMAAMGANSFLELGTGNVLTNLTRRMLPDVSAAHAGTPAEIEAILKIV